MTCSRCSCLSSVAFRIKLYAQKLVRSVTVIPEPWFGRSSSAQRVLLPLSWKELWLQTFGGHVTRSAPTVWRRSSPPRGLTGGQTEIMKGLVLFTCLQVGVAPPPAKRLPAGVPGPPPVHALARFEGLQIGAEYLEFVAGDLILIREPPPGVDAAGWAYGFLPRTGRRLFCSARARDVRARPQRSGQEEMTATRGHWLVSADVRPLAGGRSAGSWTE